MNGDRFGVVPQPEQFRQVTFGVISSGSTHPEMQIRGTAVALLAMCQATGVDVRELLESSERVMKDLDGPFSAQIKAIKAYAKGEIRRRSYF